VRRRWVNPRVVGLTRADRGEPWEGDAGGEGGGDGGREPGGGDVGGESGGDGAGVTGGARRTPALSRRPILVLFENSYECLPLRPNNNETTLEIHQGFTSQ